MSVDILIFMDIHRSGYEWISRENPVDIYAGFLEGLGLVAGRKDPRRLLAEKTATKQPEFLDHTDVCKCTLLNKINHFQSLKLGKHIPLIKTNSAHFFFSSICSLIFPLASKLRHLLRYIFISTIYKEKLNFSFLKNLL